MRISKGSVMTEFNKDTKAKLVNVGYFSSLICA